MNRAFDDLDGAILLANDPHWWRHATRWDVRAFLVHTRHRPDSSDSRPEQLERALNRKVGDIYGVADARAFSEGAFPESSVAASLAAYRAEQDAPVSTSTPPPTPYEVAAEDGIRAAADRLSAAGIDPISAAYVQPHVDPSTRQALSAEGAAATLRAFTRLNASGEVADEALLSMVWDLHAHPWDDGVLRRVATDTLEKTIGAFSDRLTQPAPSLVNEHLENTVAEERRGVSRVADLVVIATETEALRERVAAAAQIENPAMVSTTENTTAANTLLERMTTLDHREPENTSRWDDREATTAQTTAPTHRAGL